MDNLVRKNDFCVVSTRKKIVPTLTIGDVVMVIGLHPVPAKASDPYLQRLLAVVVKVEGGKVQVPRDDNEYKAVRMDPRNLTRLSDDDQKKYSELLRQQYGEELNETSN